ncbi:hypothetical protein GCM10010468_70880 [Actinocorallia longicatena]|uniref:Uncharacterized protein n=1 Tax=Actinocorallia longicatena TaxID=111803 RepID=A0ABP6QJV4_9ACTN
MRDRDALRHPRRTRRVDHIRQTVRTHLDLGSRHRLRAHLHHSQRIIQQHHPGRSRNGKIPRCLLIGQQQDRTAVGQHERDPLHRILRIDRHITSTRLPDREERRHQIPTRRQTEPDNRLSTHTLTHQETGQPGRGLIQLPIRHLDTLGGHRDRVRNLHRTRREQLHRVPRRKLGGRVVPLLQHLTAPRSVEQIDGVQPDLDGRQGRLQYPAVPVRDPFRGRLVEQARVGGDAALEPGRVALVVERLDEGDIQVEAGRDGGAVAGDRLAGDGQPGQFRGAALGVVQGQHDLVERVAGQ